MVQVAVTDLAAYFDDEITAMPNLTSVGTLTTLTVDNVIVNGSNIGHTSDTDLITVASGIVTVAGEVSMTTLDIGGTNVTSTAAELNLVDGITAGTVSASLAVIADSNKDISGFRNVTLTGELDAATGDFSGDVDIDGTLEADAITVDGTTLAEFISDTTGAMFSSNTETGITVTYQDSDNTIDLALAAAQTTITSLLATDIKIGEDNETKIDFETADEIHFYAANAEQVYVADGIFGPQTDSDVDLGSTGVRWKDAFVDSLTTTGAITVGGDLTVNGTTTTVATTNMVVADNLIELNNGASSNSNDSGIVIERGSTGDNAIFAWDESADTFILGTTTATGSSTGNLTITDGALQAGSLDISGNIDVDGTTNLDVVDIDGAVDMASTLQVDGAITSSSGMTITRSDNSDTLTLISTDADASSGPVLNLKRDSGSPADGDSIGRINFTADNDAGNLETFVRLKATMVDASDGSEDAQFRISRMVGGGDRDMLSLLSSETVFNDSSQDVDFRVESNSQVSAFLIDAGNDTATFNVPLTVSGEVAAASLDISGNVDIDGTLETDALSIASTTVTATAAEINLIDGGTARGTTAVADADGILHNDGGTMRMTSAATFKTYFQDGLSSSSAADDITAGDAAVNITTSSGNITIDAAANDTDIIFKGTDNSSDITMLTLDGSDAGTAIFNHDIKLPDNGVAKFGASSDLEIFHSSSSGNSFIKDVGTGKLILGSDGASVQIQKTDGEKMGEFNTDGSVDLYHNNVKKFETTTNGVTITGGTQDTLRLTNDDAGSGTAPDIVMYRNSSSPADNDNLGLVEFTGNQSNGGEHTYAFVRAIAKDVTAGTEDAEIQFAVSKAGAATVIANIDVNGFIPEANDTYDLGSSSSVWRNIYTGDLHLSNEAKSEGNAVDGTKGNWTIQEGSEDLYILNNKTGKKFKFKLEEI